MLKNYGGTPNVWLYETAMGVINALVIEIPKMQAEERLANITDNAVSSGTAEKNFAKRHTNQLKAACGHKVKPTKIAPKDIAAAISGIKVT